MEISPPRKMCQLFDFSRGEDLAAEFSIERKEKGGSVRCLVRSKAEEKYAEEFFSAVQGKERENVIKMRLEVREEGRRYEY